MEWEEGHSPARFWQGGAENEEVLLSGESGKASHLIRRVFCVKRYQLAKIFSGSIGQGDWLLS
jgi:hypothetical protein